MGRKRNRCPSCRRKVQATRCARCAAVARSKRQIRNRERTLNAHYKKLGLQVSQKLTGKEVHALAACDDSEADQEVVNAVIERELEIIQSRWSEGERKRRAGALHRGGWMPPVVCAVGVEEPDDGE